MCGEKRLNGYYFSDSLGSPPRVRGKGESPEKGENGLRITPACAGKRWFSARYTSAFWDHPRVCGEKIGHALALRRLLGSPPRVRGKVRNARIKYLNVRITPACAGKSMAWMPTSISRRDHPRVCGEKWCLGMHCMCDRGSPPRVRGKVQFSRLRDFHGRITPACAGKRETDFPGICPAGDHPRVCGEKRYCSPCVTTGAGSPPRVRGKGFQHAAEKCGRRITPACAGKS